MTHLFTDAKSIYTTLTIVAILGSVWLLVFYWQSKPDYKRYKTEKRRRKQIINDPSQDCWN